METQGVKKVLEMAIQQLKKSTLSKNPIQRYRYDGYMAKHYAYMVEVTEKTKPVSFDKDNEEPQWIEAMKKN